MAANPPTAVTPRPWPAWLFHRVTRTDGVALATLLAAVALLAWRPHWVSTRWLVFAAAVGGFSVLALLRHVGPALLGPMFFYDLLCAGRRGRYIAIRCVYALTLLGAIFGLYANWFGMDSLGGLPLPQDQMTQFATSFFVTFLSTQLLAVMLLAPVITAGAIAEEKERRRLDFLLATDLRNHEIVLGKLAARLLTVGMILLTGLPVLGLMQFLGGVDPNLVLAGFAVTLCSAVSIASLGIWTSAVCDKPSNAMWLTYLFVLGWLGTCWCVPGFNLGHPGVLYGEMERAVQNNKDLADELFTRLLSYGAFHVLVSGIAVWSAIICVRPSWLTMPARPRPALATAAPVPVVIYPQSLPADAAQPVLRRPRPPVDEDRPLLWKELWLEQDKSPEAIRFLVALAAIFGLIIVVMFCITAAAAALNRGKPLATVTNPMARLIGSTLGSFLLLGIAFTSVGAVSREREQHTLDGLLTLPIDRDEILRAKWVGSILSVRWMFWGLLGVWTLALVTGGLHIFALPLLVLDILAHAAFVASLGVWFSVISPNKVQAMLRALLTLFGVMVASLIFSERSAYTTPMLSLWTFAFTPSEFVKSSRFGKPDFMPTEPEQLVLGLLGALAYALLGLFLWRAACRALDAEKGPPGKVQISRPRHTP